MAEAIEALMRCAALSMQCADACLSEQDVGRLTKCIRLNLGCANLCTVTARVIARPVGCEPDVARRAIEACITVCRGSANECSAHAARLEHCRISAEASRACEQSCQALLQAMS